MVDVTVTPEWPPSKWRQPRAPRGRDVTRTQDISGMYTVELTRDHRNSIDCRNNALEAGITAKRNPISSSQQLLAKQAIALKKAVNHHQIDAIVEHAKTSTTIYNATKKQRNYHIVLMLFQHAQEDLAALRRQCMCTQQLLMYFSNRHHISHTSLQKRLQNIVSDMEADIEEAQTIFLKRHGPALFRKNGAMGTQQAAEWLKLLKNTYRNTHSALNDWHQETNKTLNQIKLTKQQNGVAPPDAAIAHG